MYWEDDWEEEDDETLIYCRQNLLIAVVKQAITDAILYLIQEELYPECEDGNPDENLFDGIRQNSYKTAIRGTYPKKLSTGMMWNPEQYAKHLIKQRRMLLRTKWEDIRREGRQALAFLSDESRLTNFTRFTTEEVMSIIRRKKAMLMAEIKEGKLEPPPFRTTIKQIKEDI